MATAAGRLRRLREGASRRRTEEEVVAEAGYVATQTWRVDQHGAFEIATACREDRETRTPQSGVGHPDTGHASLSLSSPVRKTICARR